MFLESFGITLRAILECVLMGAVGFGIIRRRLVTPEGLEAFSDLIVRVFLPFFIFTEIVGRFSFDLYPAWWAFPLLSVAMTAVGYFLGRFVLFCDRSFEGEKREFLGVVSFQNSGYLPLPLAASLLPAALAKEMFIFIFLFLLGFNMTLFSFGAMLLSPERPGRKIDLKGMLNPPVIATLAALGCVLFGVHERLPLVMLRPMETLGRCAIPLSILVVGGNLASIRCEVRPYIKPIVYALLIKLVVLPIIFLLPIIFFKPRPLVALLILLEAAMPPAALLSVIAKNQRSGGCLINQATFYGHLLSIVTVPFFLALFWGLSGKFF